MRIVSIQKNHAGLQSAVKHFTCDDSSFFVLENFLNREGSSEQEYSNLKYVLMYTGLI